MGNAENFLEKRCPVCGSEKNQNLQGFNCSGTQRCLCKECGKKYTLNPKSHTYPEEVRKHAIKIYYSGVSGRGVGKILGMNKSNVIRWIKKNEKSSDGSSTR